MVRNILALLGGYISTIILTIPMTFVLVMVFAEYRETMLEFAQNPETTVRPPFVPVLINLILGLPISVVGGAVCAAIAKDRIRMVQILAGVVVALGGLHAITNWNGFQPNWYLAGLPIVGALGIVIGGTWWAKRAGPARGL